MVKEKLNITDVEMNLAWNRLTESLQRRLTSQELAEYIQTHILPIVRKSPAYKGYIETRNLKRGSGKLEVRA